MTLQESIGLKIKNLREINNLSQTELAHKVGYSDKASISKIEKGLVDLPQSKLLIFSNIFNVDISYWFDDNDNHSLSNQVNTLAAHFEGEEFSEEEMDEIKNFVEFVKNKRK